MWKVVLPLILVLLCGLMIMGLADDGAMKTCMQNHSAEVCYNSIAR